MSESLFVFNKLIPDVTVDLIQYPEPHPSLNNLETFNAFFSNDVSSIPLLGAGGNDAKIFYSNIINSVDALGNIYYSSNSLLSRLETVEPDAPFDVFIADIGNVVAFFKFQNTETDPGLIINNFLIKNLNKTVLSSTGFSIEINLQDDAINEIKDFFRASGIPVPHFGMLQFTITYSTGMQQTYACKFTLDPIFAIAPTAPAASIVNSFTTAGTTYEALFVPELTGAFVYNFFQSNEEDEGAFKTKNYANFPLNEIPKFVKLNWNAAPYSPATMAPVSRDGAIFSPTTTGPIPLGPMGPTGIDTLGHIDAGVDSPAPGAGSAGGGIDATTLITIRPDALAQIATQVTLDANNSGYIGYVILKEKLEQDTGDFVPFDVLVINNVRQTQIIDWKIGYGETYRYKIRSLYRFVDKDNVSIYEDSNSVLTRAQELDVFGIRRIDSYLYFFDSDFSVEQVLTCTEDQRPDFPTNFLIFPNSKERNILLIWNQKNANLDVAGFNVYKKENNNKAAFKKCNNKLLELRQNFYIDYDIEIDQEYIYAVESIDFHGNFSALSLQVIAQITNFDIDLGRNEEVPRFYAQPGLELSEKQPSETNTAYTYFKNKFNVKINPVFTELAGEKKFILRILSLDTLITKEIKMKFKLTTITKRTPRQLFSDVNRIITPNMVGGQDINSVEDRIGGAAATEPVRSGVGTAGTGVRLPGF